MFKFTHTHWWCSLKSSFVICLPVSMETLAVDTELQRWSKWHGEKKKRESYVGEEVLWWGIPPERAWHDSQGKGRGVSWYTVTEGCGLTHCDRGAWPGGLVLVLMWVYNSMKCEEGLSRIKLKCFVDAEVPHDLLQRSCTELWDNYKIIKYE